METSFTVKQADRHIHELRRARQGWVKILEESNYASTEALENLLRISQKIEALKGIFPGEFWTREPSLDETESRSRSWTPFVSAKDDV